MDDTIDAFRAELTRLSAINGQQIETVAELQAKINALEGIRDKLIRNVETLRREKQGLENVLTEWKNAANAIRSMLLLTPVEGEPTGHSLIYDISSVLNMRDHEWRDLLLQTVQAHHA